MELKVYIDGTHSGLHRIVSGVTETTTCQDIVYALAHATGQTGRFKLIERSRSSEKLLAPHENPLKILSDWGEYSNHVQFVLLRSESDSANANDANKQQQSQTQHQQQLLLQSHQQIIRKTLQQQQQLIGDKLANNTIKNNNVNGAQQNDHKKFPKQDGATAAAVSLSSTTSSSSPPLIAVQILERNKESRKSFGSLSDGKYNVENVGIVKGIPQQNQQQPPSRTISPPSLSPASSSSSTRISSAVGNNIPPINTSTTSFHENIPISPIHSSNNSTASIELNSSVMTGSGGGGDGAGTNSSSASSTLTTPIKLQQQQQQQQQQQSIEFNTADVRNSLERKTTNSNTNNNTNNNNNNNIFRDNKIPNNSINEQLFDSYNFKNCPPISSNGALVPPPYRDPPPPRTSPLHQKNDSFSNGSNTNNVNGNNNYNNNNNNGNNNLRQFEFKENVNTFLNGKDVNELLYHNNDNGTTIAYQNAQCKELIQLIKFQRDKLNAQQADLTKFDAEILYLENRDREHLKQIDAMKREINISEQIYCETSEQLQTLQYVEEENELVFQQEKTIKSEITLLRSKLANCETELLQLKNKETLLQNDVDIEKRCKFNQNQQQQQQMQHQQQQQQELDNNIQYEIINMKADSMQLIQNSVLTNKTMENLKRELTRIETIICDKKKQVEQLVNEMKEVNLQSLAITPSEEIRNLLEGSNRQGSSRRIIGSPRQLETAVPTSKNPHGVWV